MENLTQNQIDNLNQSLIACELFGIDPGISNGGITKYVPDKPIETLKMDKLKDFNDMCDWFRYQKEICKLPLVILENITSHSSDYGEKGETEKQKSIRIGRSMQLDKMKTHYAELRGAIKLARLPYIEVMPMSWQAYLKIRIKGEDYLVRKERFKDIAREFYPSVKVAAWNADSLLLVEFARRKLKYDRFWIVQNIKKPEKSNPFHRINQR